MFGLFKRQESAPRRVRVVRRTASAVRSSFAGAEISNLFADWTTASKPINLELESELRTLRARSRSLRMNDGYIRRFHQLCRSNVVGPNGFVLRSEVTRKNGKVDGLARDAIEKAWKKANKKGAVCTLGKYTLKDIQNKIIDQVTGEGEVIIIVTYGKSQGPFGISFRFIDTELMDVNHKEVRAPYQVRMGIETDKVGKVVAYHFHSTDATHSDYYSFNGRGYLRIPKSRIIHEFMSDYVDQLRGFPHSVAAMARLKMLGGYEEAELVAARVNSAAMGFIERGEHGGGIDDVETMIDDETGEEIEIIDERVEPTIDMEPGFHFIDNGAKVHTFQTTHPTTAYKDYIKTVLRGIASGLGIDYNTLANDLEGVNFSSLRGGVLESRELWKCFQTWVIEHVMIEIFERWLLSALLSNAIRLPRGDALRAVDFERLSEASFQGRRWAWVDPVKDLQAAKLSIDEGLSSRSEIIRERGGDPEQVWSEIQKEKELMKKYGVEIISKPTESKVTYEDESEDQDDVEEKE